MHLFISYAHTNFKKVKKLADLLEEVGYEVWFDEELRGGEDWWQGILSEIEKCDVFVYALSIQSKTSSACDAELKYARQLNKIILPVRLEPVEMPTDLKSVHYEDAFRLSYEKVTLALARALNHLQKQLPHEKLTVINPKPDRPVFPFPPDYIGDLRLRLQQLDQATPQEAAKMVFALKQIGRTKNPAIAREARDLLRQMLYNPHITLAVREEIMEALAADRRRWRVIGVGVVLVLALFTIGAVWLSEKIFDGKPSVAQADLPVEEIAAPALNETAVPGEAVKLAFDYAPDQPLTLHFETDAPSIWLFGLELRWTDAAGQAQKLDFNKLYPQVPLYNLSAAACLQLKTAEQSVESPCTLLTLENAFWEMPGGLFSVWQADRQVGVCAVDEATCEVNWSNEAIDRRDAGIDLIMEWTGADLITLRFDSVQPTLDLTQLQFTLSLPHGGGQRFYFLNAFTQLNEIPGFNLRHVPANACIMLGANRGVAKPSDERCQGGLFFDNRAVETTQSAFWDGRFGQFAVHLNETVIGQCDATAHQCRVKLN